jgi:pimeloyl-ACP methyl ester carboxylesterase
VHFHGNGEVVGDWLDVLPGSLRSLGWNVLLVEYRGYRMSTGEPGLGKMLDDVERVVRASGIAPERTVFFGRSIGSFFAVHAVSHFPNAAGLILESGIFDVLERNALRVEPSELGVTPTNSRGRCGSGSISDRSSPDTGAPSSSCTRGTTASWTSRTPSSLRARRRGP